MSDVYYPTDDNTNVETLQYVVTDGSTFTDLQQRDMTYTASALDRSGMSCRVTATARSGRYRVITDYVADPARDTILMRVRFQPLIRGKYRLYARLDPTVNGNGGGGSDNAGADAAVTDTSTGHDVLVSSDPRTATSAANRDYAQPVYMAFDGPFSQVTYGFAGRSSDGLTQLDQAHTLTTTYDSALNGNAVQVAQITSRDGGSGRAPSSFTLALGFGATQAGAVQSAEASLRKPFSATLQAYDRGWRRYDDRLRRPPARLPGLSRSTVRRLDREYYVSANVVKASEDKTFAGAISAGLASPWGQAMSAGDPNITYFGSYREIFARDLYEAWTGLMADDDTATARDAVLFLFDRQQQPDGSMPRNSLLNGKLAPDSFNTQLDECSYPILMAYQMGMTDRTLYADHIKPAANFVVSHGPSFGPERWEEQSGYSPSTIAAEIAGLLAAANIANVNHDAVSAREWRAVADDYQRSIKSWSVTSSGPLADHPYFHSPVQAQDGRPQRRDLLQPRQRRPHAGPAQRRVPRARTPGRPARDRSRHPAVAAARRPHHRVQHPERSRMASLQRRRLRRRCGRRPSMGAHRQGHRPPVASPLLRTRRAGPADGRPGHRCEPAAHNGQLASGLGLIPEQDWELPDLTPSPYGTDPAVASIGFMNGHPAGSAAPLTWSAGSYVRLAADLGAGRLLDQPRNTV